MLPRFREGSAKVARRFRNGFHVLLIFLFIFSFSEEDQVEETLKKHYPNKENLVLLRVNAVKLEHLLWEQASNGDMYPHLYSTLDTSTVVNEYDLPLNEDGKHKLPEVLKKYQFSRPR